MQIKVILLAAVASIAGAAPAAAPEPNFFCVGPFGCGFGETCQNFRCQSVVVSAIQLAAGAAIIGAVANNANGGAAPALPTLPSISLPTST